MNPHSLRVSMEQLAGLCWATCEAVVLAAGLWGAEQDAGAHS